MLLSIKQLMVTVKSFCQRATGTDTELNQAQNAKFLHLDGTSHVSCTLLGLIQANVFTVNKPCGMEFN